VPPRRSTHKHVTQAKEQPPSIIRLHLLVLEKGRVLDRHGGIDLDGGGWALAETNLAAAHEIGRAITVETLKASAVIGRRLGSVVSGEGFFRWFHGALTVVVLCDCVAAAQNV
jgi:hypothetical protein